MPDTAQFSLYVPWCGDISVGKVAEVQLDAGRKAPFQGYFIDGNGSGSAVHGRMVVVWCVEMCAVVRPERQFFDCPTFLAWQVVGRKTGEKSGNLVCRLAMPEIFNLRQHERRIGRKSGLERYGKINEMRHWEWVSWYMCEEPLMPRSRLTAKRIDQGTEASRQTCQLSPTDRLAPR